MSTHTPTSPLWKSSHVWFPCHQNDSSIADKRNSQVLSRRRTRNAFFLFAHQIKNYCLWSKAEIAGQKQQNLAPIWGNTETHCRWKLCLPLKEKHLCRNIITTKSLSSNTELHEAFRTKEVCTCFPYKTWPSVLPQVLSKLLLDGLLISESTMCLAVI